MPATGTVYGGQPDPNWNPEAFQAQREAQANVVASNQSKIDQRKADSAGEKDLMGPILNVVGTLVGSAVGMPFLGAILGGGAGGLLGNGTGTLAEGNPLKNALLGALTSGLGYGAGGLITKGLSGLTGGASGLLGGGANAVANAATTNATQGALGGAVGSAVGNTLPETVVTALSHAPIGSILGSGVGGAITSAANGGGATSGNPQQKPLEQQPTDTVSGGGGVDAFTPEGLENDPLVTGALTGLLSPQTSQPAPEPVTLDPLTVTGPPDTIGGLPLNLLPGVDSDGFAPMQRTPEYLQQVAQQMQDQNKPGVIEDTIGQTLGGVGADYAVNSVANLLGLNPSAPGGGGGAPAPFTDETPGGLTDVGKGGVAPPVTPFTDETPGGLTDIGKGGVAPAVTPDRPKPGGSQTNPLVNSSPGSAVAPAAPGAAGLLNTGGAAGSPSAATAPSDLALQGGFSPDIFPWRKVPGFGRSALV